MILLVLLILMVPLSSHGSQGFSAPSDTAGSDGSAGKRGYYIVPLLYLYLYHMRVFLAVTEFIIGLLLVAASLSTSQLSREKSHMH